MWRMVSTGTRRLALRFLIVAGLLSFLTSCHQQMLKATPFAGGEHKQAAGKLREVLARYTEAEDLINIGAYVKGSNPKIDYALSKIDQVNAFLKQGTFDQINYEETVNQLLGIFG